MTMFYQSTANMKYHLCFLVAIILINICKGDNNAEVKIKQGVLIGKIEKTYLKKEKYYAFRGIPYATPPTDSLRFKPPIPYDGWEGVYEAHDDKPSCYQYNSRKKLGDEYDISGSEDCLYLSVFSSDLKGSAPVLVFDYNEDFRSGYNGTDVYSPDFFLQENIVVVIINHRLGLFGYLTTNDDVIPPNNGLKDFILGLKWVKDNIDNFGGDPNRITLMGNRGGAVLADILLRSEKAKGLFDAAIIHSGTALESIFFDKDPREKAFKFAKALKIEANNSKTLLSELQKLDANTLITNDGEAVDETLIEKYQLSIFPFSPTIEEDHPDAIITSLPENGKIVNDVPVLIGMNSREGLDLASHYIFDPKLIEGMGGEFLMVFPIRTSFYFDRKGDEYDKAIRKILDFYFEEGYFYYANILEYAVYVGDLRQNYALNRAAKTLANNIESSVFYYMFDFRGLLNENSEYMTRHARLTMQHWGATIGDELCYLFLCKRIKRTYSDLTKLVSEQPELKVLKKMVRLWTNFIKTRNPTPEEEDLLPGFKWEPISKGSENTSYLHITKAFKMDVNPLGKREQFWDEFLETYSKLAVDGVVGKKHLEHDEL